MRIRINRSELHEFYGHSGKDWNHIIGSTHPRGNRVGIFQFDLDHYYGGWISLPLTFEFQFEALSYTKRKYGNMLILEIIVRTKEELIQIAHQLTDFRNNWKLPDTFSEEQPSYKIVSDEITEIKKFIQEVKATIQNTSEKMTWREANSVSWGDIKQKIGTYENFLQSIRKDKILCQQFDVPKISQALSSLKGKTSFDYFKEVIFDRELESFKQHFNVLSREYEKIKGSSTLETLNRSKKKTEKKLEELRELNNNAQSWNIYSRGHRGQDERQKNMSSIQNSFSELIRKIQEEEKILEQQMKHKNKQQTIDQVVLQQLKKLTPGIQTQLTRICELTSIERKFVEKSVIRLLDKHPDIGSYDELSQVFIPGKNLTREIDKLLAQFDDAKK